jgi:phosphohistidine phosphatase
MRIAILRHGDASSPTHGDAWRYLTPSGRAQLRSIGEQLREHGEAFDLILSSPLIRAVQSAELLAQGVGYEGEILIHPPLVPGGTSAKALAPLDRLPEEARVALVSHEPTVRVLAGQMLGEPAGHFMTAELRILEWDGARAQLVRKLFP